MILLIDSISDKILRLEDYIEIINLVVLSSYDNFEQIINNHCPHDETLVYKLNNNVLTGQFILY